MISFVKELKTASVTIFLLLLLFVLEFLFHGKIPLNNIEIVLIVLAIQIPVTAFLLVKMRSIINESSRLQRAIKHTLSYGLCLSTAMTLNRILKSQTIDFGEVLWLFLIWIITNFVLQFVFDFTTLVKQKKQIAND